MCVRHVAAQFFRFVIKINGHFCKHTKAHVMKPASDSGAQNLFLNGREREGGVWEVGARLSRYSPLVIPFPQSSFYG